ncbi:MAG: aminotransferase class III-fold pyridoxal phosphate-dependent enzyme [Pseudolysinimonas sp.]
MTGPTSYFDPAHIGELDARTADLVRRRADALGPAYRLFYRQPIEFVRGERAHLFDRDGADYLDAYNNVPSVGHAHPRVVAAIAEQAARLNTHTRYLSEATIDYAEQLLATFPGELGTPGRAHVMFTCTGSEANDLALRVAKAATGGEGVVVTWNAYHGVTTEVAGISPSLVGLDGMPPWARAVRAPGRVPGGPGANIAEAVEATIGELAAFGIRPAALIVDTIFASDGVHPDVDGLVDAVAIMRKAGGLFIADEVQAGFGRLGDGMWGYARHHLDPDIVTLGKPMGNGHPIAAMVTKREVLEPFAAGVRYFNTFGGNAVAIAAAQATLDVVRDEGLAGSARAIGLRIADGVRAFGHPRIGEVRGAGLFLGVDLVDATGAPDEALTLDVVNGLRDRRVLVSSTAADNATLKIRPPLVFDESDADRLLTELAAVLRNHG